MKQKLVTIGLLACTFPLALLISRAQEGSDTSHQSPPFVAYSPTTGHILPFADKTHVCTDAYVTAPALLKGEVDEMFDSYAKANLIPANKRAAYTVVMLIPYGLGGAPFADNLLPLKKDALYNAADKARLDAALRQDVCHGPANIDATRNTLAKDWVAVFIAKFGKKQAPK